MEYIYGVDLSKKITSLMVRDAIIICFKQAHKEVLDLMDEYMKWESEAEREEFRNLEIELIVRNAFKEAGVDFNNPTKEDFPRVLNNLAQFALRFRKPEIIQKHYNAIERLVDKIDDTEKD